MTARVEICRWGRADVEWREPVGEDFVGQIVVIGTDAASMRDELVTRLKECLENE